MEKAGLSGLGVSNIAVDGSKIRHLRNSQLRITMEELAARLGISARQLANIELGRTKRVNVATFAGLCNVLGVSAVAIQPRGLGPYVSVARLPTVGEFLVGREQKCQQLDNAWHDPNTRIVSIVAPGGVGKTALAIHWWHRKGAPNAERFLGWSFHSQGSADDRQESAEIFIDYALREFGIVDTPADSWQRGVRLAKAIRGERTLVILDGIEPIQHPPGEQSGRLKDRGMVALLKELAAQSSGLCICTSRLPLTDLLDYANVGVLPIELENLSPESGGDYLKTLGVEGPAEELSRASQEFGNHALALTLLGTLLVRRCGRDVRRRDTLPPLSSDPKHGGNARRIFRWYEQVFEGCAELDMLRMLGLFDRPLDSELIKALQTLSWEEWVKSLENLKDARLVEYSNPEGPIDCHPLTREHFAAEYRGSKPLEFQQAHSRLFDHYSHKKPSIPKTLEEMVPCFRAIYHGCRSDRYQDACVKVYRERIQRGDDYYLMRNLGAFGANLSVLANFFDVPWRRPSGHLTKAQQAESLSEAGFALRAVGRLQEALDPMEEAASRHLAEGNIREAARQLGNLAELQASLGYLRAATETATRSVAYADDSKDIFERLKQRTKLANILHQSGDLARATRLFEEAEAMQREWRPSHQFLIAYRGYQYCDLLISKGLLPEAIHRATVTIEVERKNGTLLTIALCDLVLGNLDAAVEGLQQSGSLDDLPRGLLARGSPDDLDEARVLATRCGMRLYLADYHIKQARNQLDAKRADQALSHFEIAARLVQETGYHRRDAELEELAGMFGGV